MRYKKNKVFVFNRRLLNKIINIECDKRLFNYYFSHLLTIMQYNTINSNNHTCIIGRRIVELNSFIKLSTFS